MSQLREMMIKGIDIKINYKARILWHIFIVWWAIILPTSMSKDGEEVKIGLIVDLSSGMGKMVEKCIQMARSDFYQAHPSYATRLVFRTKNSDNVFAAASGALELLKNEEVRAILGPLTSPEAKFVVELGAKAQVPIVSFSATSSSISPLHSPYFVRMAAADSSQLKAVTTLIQGFEWREVIIVYEETHTGYQDGFIRDLTVAFQEADIRISFLSAISASANDSQILNELEKLKAMSTTVFLVHTTSLLGSRIFLHANTKGMMSKGYAWLITDGLSNLLDTLDDAVIDTMEGILGIRPYVPKSKDLETFKMRLKRELQFTRPKAELNIFGLWAYDAVWALAMAVERIGPMGSGFAEVTGSQNSSDMAMVGSSEVGPLLLKEILNTRFKGLSGEFSLVHGQLQISAFEILHVIGKGERPIGYWTPDRGLSREPNFNNNSSNYSTSVSALKNIIWPGDSTDKPRDWAIPKPGKRLKVGVPVKEGFTEFVKLEHNRNTGEFNITGFCADIFREVLMKLPLKFDNPEIIPFLDPATGKSAGNYNDLLKQLEEKIYDIVVADVTILPEREQIVDFSRQYLETEVVMLRRAKYDKGKDIWIFVKPLSSYLWLTIAITCIFMGLIIRTLERRVTRERLGMLLWFPLASLAFPESNMVSSNWSKFVLVIWLFMAFIIMQSYTASLSSFLTVAQLQHSADSPYCVGFQTGSFVKELLLDRMNFDESKIKSYSSAEQYRDALSKGCNNGGVDAIFDELPYIKIFIDTYGKTNYKMEGSSYKTGGLGFAFPKGSPLTPIFSSAILSLTGGGEINAIVTKNFGLEYSDRDYFPDIPSSSSSIGVRNLGGLFIISGCMTIMALLFSTPSFQRLFASISAHYRQICVYPSPSLDANETSVHPTAETNASGNLSTTASATHENSISIAVQTDEDVAAEDRKETENNIDNGNAIDVNCS